MAQTGFTPISNYYSTTASAVPTAVNLVPGELAINTADGKLYYEDSSGVVQVLATKSTGSIGGSNTQVQFNNSGSLGGSSGLTWDGSFLTTSSIKNSALTSGRVTYAGASGLLTDSANLLYSGTDLTVYGVRVGRGGGAISTNTAVGASALAANTSGADNTALGLNALASNNSGINNTASGRFALTANTTGVGNTASGYSSLATNIAGNYNTASGGLSLFSNTGNNNTAMGYDALNNNTASNNTAVGYQAAYSGTTATQVVAVGSGALYANTVNYGTAVGFNALNANTTGAANAAFGAYALATNTTGAGNSAFGALGFGLSDSALQANTTGSYNSAFGLGALAKNTTASNNTAVGYQAGYSNTTGVSHTVFGYQAGYSNVSGNQNCFFGPFAGNATTGGLNTFVGGESGSLVTSGIKNTILGRYTGNQGGLDIRTASNYIVLSDGDGNPRAYWNGANATFGGSLTTTNATTGIRNNITSTDRISVTGATTIFSITLSGSSVGASSAVLLVNGYDTGTTTNSFTDLVLFIGGVTPVVISSVNRGSPAARTYTASGGTALQLAMASGTYNVASSSTEQAC